MISDSLGTTDDAVLRLVSRLARIPEEQVEAGTGLGTDPGWDSLQHIEILVGIEDIIGRPIADEEYGSLVDVRSICSLLRSATASDLAPSE